MHKITKSAGNEAKTSSAGCYFGGFRLPLADLPFGRFVGQEFRALANRFHG